MSLVRLTIGVLFISALFLTAASGWCAEQSIDQQIAERTKQYQESLRQRAAQLSPSLQAKIENQAEQTVAKNTAKWRGGEIALKVALPRLAEAKTVARLLARHLPFFGSPFGSFTWKAGICDAVLTVMSVQTIVKSLAVSVVDAATIQSAVLSSQKVGDILTFFLRVIHTVVQRR